MTIFDGSSLLKLNTVGNMRQTLTKDCDHRHSNTVFECHTISNKNEKNQAQQKKLSIIVSIEINNI